MKTKSGNLTLRVSVAIAFIAMVVVNYLAQMLPINGVTPGQISDSLPNLFTPTGLTFSIWGVIYLLLAAFTVFQFIPRWTAGINSMNRVRLLFVLSSLANIGWIFAWHYRIFPLSMILMLLLLITLIMINKTLLVQKNTASSRWLVRLPFSLYFGWITVATVANITALLVSIGWDGFGISEPIWAAIILLVAMLIGTVTMVVHRDIAYGLVLIWAYVGILIKHVSPNGFSSAYPLVISVLIACLVAFAAAEVYVILGIARKGHSVSDA